MSFGTLLTLFVVPVVYVLIARDRHGVSVEAAADAAAAT